MNERTGHDHIVNALMKHGITDSVAVTIRAIGDELRRRTVESGNEHAAMVDSALGEHVGEILEGDAGRTDISAHLASLRAESTYIQIHTHPKNSIFSEVDIQLFLDTPSIHITIVIGVSNHWFVMSELRSDAVRDPITVLEMYRDAQRVAVASYRDQLESGTTPLDGINHAIRHDALSSLAEQIGLRYDRIAI